MRLVDLVPGTCSGTRRAQDQDTRGHTPGTRLTCADTRGHTGHKIANTPGHTGTQSFSSVPVPVFGFWAQKRPLIVTRMDADSPPNFAGTYPLNGELIGPAWRAAWQLLAQARKPVPVAQLVEAMQAAAPIQDKTARGLLSGARRARIVSVTYDGPRRSGRYRVNPTV